MGAVEGQAYAGTASVPGRNGPLVTVCESGVILLSVIPRGALFCLAGLVGVGLWPCYVIFGLVVFFSSCLSASGIFFCLSGCVCPLG